MFHNLLRMLNIRVYGGGGGGGGGEGEGYLKK